MNFRTILYIYNSFVMHFLQNIPYFDTSNDTKCTSDRIPILQKIRISHHNIRVFRKWIIAYYAPFGFEIFSESGTPHLSEFQSPGDLFPPPLCDDRGKAGPSGASVGKAETGITGSVIGQEIGCKN